MVKIYEKNPKKIHAELNIIMCSENVQKRPGLAGSFKVAKSFSFSTYPKHADDCSNVNKTYIGSLIDRHKDW